MKLSIIVPAYNAESTIITCLDSILKQTLADFELVVVNDGSCDSTGEILARYQSSFPEKIKVLTVENGGQGRARNIGMGIASGEFIGFVDSDDWIEPQMYEKMMRIAVSNFCDLVHCDVLAHFPDGKTSMEKVYRPDCPMASAGFANNKLFRKDLVETIRFPEDKLWYEDTEFTARCILRAKKEQHVDEALYHYRRGHPSTMNNQNALKNLDILTVMNHLEDDFLPDHRDDYEFLILNHVLLDAMNRVQAMEAEEKNDVMWLMRQFVRDKIPHLYRAKSYRRETRNRRIIMSLHYAGFSGVAEKLIQLKNGR